MEPENEPLEEEIPIKNHHFSGSMVVFGVYTLKFFFWVLPYHASNPSPTAPGVETKILAEGDPWNACSLTEWPWGMMVGSGLPLYKKAENGGQVGLGRKWKVEQKILKQNAGTWVVSPFVSCLVLLLDEQNCQLMFF